jgi:steroid delta-isomerase-like uncharacterized protein
MIAVESTDVMHANEALVRQYYDTLNAHTPEVAATRLAEILAEDFIFHPPNNVDGYAGRDRHLDWLAWHHRTVSEQHFVLDDLLADSSRAATRWTVSGVQTGEFLGVPASGSALAATGQDYFHLRAGRITEMWRSMDIREVIRQFTAGTV